MSILKKIKKNKKAYAVRFAVQSLFDPEYADAVYAIRHDRNELTIRNYGTENKGRILYYLYMNDSSGGFFALLRWTCTALLYADNRGFIPYVEYGHDCKYYDAENTECDNPFEYFFTPVSELSKKDFAHAFNVVNFDAKHLYEVATASSHQLEPEIVSEFAGIWRRYIHINDYTTEKLTKDISSLFKDKKKTLAVHFRGTDYKENYKNHPIAVKLEEEIEIAKQAIDKEGFQRIFIASDEEEAVKRFKDEFGDIVVYYSDTIRSADGKAVHDTIHNRQNDRYLLGYEVLRDAWTMSQCDGLVAGVSNVSFFAMIMKEAFGETFESCNIIYHGKNSNGKKYIAP